MRHRRCVSIAAILLAAFAVTTVFAETTAYIASSGTDEVIRVIASSEAVTTTPVADTPYGIAVTPDGRQVLVTQNEAGALVFINTSDFSGTPFELTVGNSPRGVAVDPTGEYAFVANFDDDTISQVSVNGRSIVDTITVGDGPWGVAAHYDELKDTAVVYVADHFDGTVTMIDEDNQTMAIDVGDGPVGLAVTPDGANVYVANTDDDSVSVIDTHTATVVDTVNVGSAPWGIAVGAEGRYIYVTDSGDDTVSVIQTSDNSIAGTYPVGRAPRGVSAPRNGTFAYIVNQNDGSISKLNVDTGTVIEFAAGVVDDAYSIGAFIGDRPPSEPSDLEAESRDDDGIDLRWTDNSIDEKGFKIERSRENGDNYTQIATVAENATTYEDANLNNNTTYYYRIRAYNEAADSEYSASANATTERYSGSIWCFIDTLIK